MSTESHQVSEEEKLINRYADIIGGLTVLTRRHLCHEDTRDLSRLPELITLHAAALDIIGQLSVYGVRP